MQPYLKGQLPKNIEIVEVFLQAGVYMGNHHAQQNYVYSNFTHWLRDMIEQGCNVFSQMIARREIDGQSAYSMSGDAYALDILPRLQELREQGKRVAVIGQVNDELPFMYNDAIVPAETYDFILDDPKYNHTLLGPPSPPVDTMDYMIGLNAVPAAGRRYTANWYRFPGRCHHLRLHIAPGKEPAVQERARRAGCAGQIRAGHRRSRRDRAL